MKIIIQTILILCIYNVSLSFEKPNQDIILAMKHEMKRSLSELSIDKLEKPYFIEYKFVEYDAKSIRSSLGSIESSSNSKSANISVGVRVGNYQFDNTNFFDVGLGFFGSSDDEESFKNRNVSYNPDYNYLRKEFWLATDAAYKQTAELYSKKQAVLKNRMRNDSTPDFTKIITPNISKDLKDIPDFDINYYENIINNVSKVFTNYKDIFVSSVSIEFIPKRTYYVNSEGSEFIRDSYYTGFEIVAACQNKEGMPIFDHFTAFSNDPKNLPSLDSLINAAIYIAENIDEKLKINQLEDFYVGPIIFSEQAACQIFIQSFLPKLISQREPITEGGFSSDNEDAAFQRKVGGRVLPEFLSVYDKPFLNKEINTDLIGTYSIDDDGLMAKDVEIIKDGYLETLLSDRVPTKRITESNAHKRGGSVMYSNIIIENSDEEKSLSDSELENKIIEMIKKRELEYGIIITKILDANIRYTSLYRILNGNIEIPFGKKDYIMEGYKIFQNGKKEKFSGMVLPPMNVLLFKDILFTSNNNYTLNFLAPAIISPYLSGGESYLPSSITSPNLLFEDAEVHLIEDDFKKPPYIESSSN